jgi:hypothetical protein
LLLSNYLLKGVKSCERNLKGTCPRLFNFLSQLLKAKKGAKGHQKGAKRHQKEIPFFLMASAGANLCGHNNFKISQVILLHLRYRYLHYNSMAYTN